MILSVLMRHFVGFGVVSVPLASCVVGLGVVTVVMTGGVAWMSFVICEISSFLMLSMPSSSETSLMVLEGTRALRMRSKPHSR